ncbi:hypothetical protein OIU76_014957 [Salix suchowensis]|uniref:Uncharacterized protein n=1 Tax=Salix koriyanagi TaxID=2511006 RepID=A0A9Q0TR28_9ROSI|nr:hypothetical protein OIU76_014957 [Salix suchowensis]KAJ6716210.1 hypothetical protein OIU74_008854 [Salix koriyanagi]
MSNCQSLELFRVPDFLCLISLSLVTKSFSNFYRPSSKSSPLQNLPKIWKRNTRKLSPACLLKPQISCMDSQDPL